ncbi:MAG: endonuclease [Gammaproteobacteria bacterium]|nr:MAG: endonuclease [Gammaproteobacteria bacterium]
MPEGPSIVILKELAEDFVGKKILRVGGNSKIDLSRLVGQQIKSLRTFGKQFLIEFSEFSIRVHLLMFGTYLINERKEATPRLSLQFANKKEINFYACSVKYLEGDLDNIYDWSADVMSKTWDPAAARAKIKSLPESLVCDVLLNQDIFAGVGNIIKNEVLFRIRVHPLSQIEFLPSAKLRALIEEAHKYSFEFLAWKKAFVLKKHWLAHNKSTCPRCKIPFERAYLGKNHRRSFFCEKCQKKYAPD